jgi:7-keto-8-aminopelargonate synthetase-like enzyme
MKNRNRDNSPVNRVDAFLNFNIKRQFAVTCVRSIGTRRVSIPLIINKDLQATLIETFHTEFILTFISIFITNFTSIATMVH